MMMTDAVTTVMKTMMMSVMMLLMLVMRLSDLLLAELGSVQLPSRSDSLTHRINSLSYSLCHSPGWTVHWP